MKLSIQDLLPSYFESARKGGSEIWGKDLAFNKGELIKIVAPSGSGKSSLVNFLYGMRKDYTGSILYDGRPLRDFQAEDMAAIRKDRISIVFQDLRLFPMQTVRENLLIKWQLQPYHTEARIAEMADRLGIGDKLGSLCGTCSYGEQQRIAIIRSLLQPFELLLLDEPFSHLDNNNARLAMELMLEEARLRNACILFADLERVDHYPHTRLFHL